MVRLRDTEQRKVHLGWTPNQAYCGKRIPSKSKYITQDMDDVTCLTCKRANGKWSLKAKPRPLKTPPYDIPDEDIRFRRAALEWE